MSDRGTAATDGRSRVPPINRRRFLHAAVAGGIAGLAGCSGDSPDAAGVTGDGDTPDTADSGGSEDTASEPRETTDEPAPDATGTPSDTGGGGAATTEYEPREGCTVGTATDVARDETVTVHPIHGDPESGGMRFTYQGTDAEGQGEIRVEYPDGLTLDNYLEGGERLDITEGTGIELTELGERRIRVQFLRIPEEYDSRSEWDPTEVELC